MKAAFFLDRTLVPATLAAVGLVTASTLFVGCGNRYFDFCNAQAECQGGNDADIDACAAEASAAEEIAAAYDCSDAFDKVADCTERTGNCDSHSYETNCSDENEALSRCVNAASARDDGGGSSVSVGTGGGNSSTCKDLEKKCEECGGTKEACAVPDGSDPSACQAALDLYDSLGCG